MVPRYYKLQVKKKSKYCKAERGHGRSLSPPLSRILTLCAVVHSYSDATHYILTHGNVTLYSSDFIIQPLDTHTIAIRKIHFYWYNLFLHFVCEGICSSSVHTPPFQPPLQFSHPPYFWETSATLTRVVLS